MTRILSSLEGQSRRLSRPIIELDRLGSFRGGAALVGKVFGPVAIVFVLVAGGVVSCGKTKPSAPPAQGLAWSHSPAVCGQDEVREYFCDALLPLTSALPAPAPYSNCPSTIDHHEGYHEPRPPIAVFDKSYTGYIRRRNAPGNACCYSWCAGVEVKSLDDVLPQAGCGEPLVIRETYCFPTLEGGTSAPASDALPRCPVAIRPPEGKAFSVPPAAPLDLVSTNQRRAQGFDECCYGWCSHQPGGTY